MSKLIAIKRLASKNHLLANYWENSHRSEAIQRRQRNQNRCTNELTNINNQNSDLTDQILSRYQSCRDQLGTTWMKRLTQQTIEFLAHQRGVQVKFMQEESLYNQATIELLQMIFVQLQTYTYDFNQVMAWNELTVTATKPSFVTEILRYSKFREPLETVTHLRARLSTRYMSLVIKGQRDEIAFLYMPVDKVIGLSKTECAFEPTYKLKASRVDGQICWGIGNEMLSKVCLEKLCRSLFADLIEHSKVVFEEEHCA